MSWWRHQWCRGMLSESSGNILRPRLMRTRTKKTQLLPSWSSSRRLLPIDIYMWILWCGSLNAQRKSRSSSMRNTSVRVRTITLQGRHMSTQCQPCSWSSMKVCWPQFLERFFQCRVSWLAMPGTRQSSPYSLIYCDLTNVDVTNAFRKWGDQIW